MSNIVEQLRQYAVEHEPWFLEQGVGPSKNYQLMMGAAAEIARQTLIIQNLELELERIKTKNASLYNLLATINKQGGLDYNTHDLITTAISITTT